MEADVVGVGGAGGVYRSEETPGEFFRGGWGDVQGVAAVSV